MFRRLLHPQHLCGIWSDLTPYRLPFDTHSEYPEPRLQQTRGSPEKKSESQTQNCFHQKTFFSSKITFLPKTFFFYKQYFSTKTCFTKQPKKSHKKNHIFLSETFLSQKNLFQQKKCFHQHKFPNNFY